MVAVLALPAGAADLKTDLLIRFQALGVRHQTEHYELAGDVEARRFEEYGRCLEHIYAEYAKGFEMLLKAEPGKTPGAKGGQAKPARSQPSRSDAAGEDDDATTRFPVAIFAKPEEYSAFADPCGGGKAEHTRGKFFPGQLLLILDQEDSEETYEVLFHEAFHQFLYRYVKHPPMWLNEGMAVYFGTARPVPDGLVFDRPREHYWDVCRKLIRKGAAIPMSDVIHANRDTFYDLAPIGVEIDDQPIRRKSAFYAESYTLVHMLLGNPPFKERLHAYIRDLAAGNPPTREITAKHFSPETCASLTTAWSQYVLGQPEKK